MWLTVSVLIHISLLGGVVDCQCAGPYLSPGGVVDCQCAGPYLPPGGVVDCQCAGPYLSPGWCG